MTVGSVALALLLAPVAWGEIQCDYTTNKRVVYVDGYGAYCGYYGSGCTYCTDDVGRECAMPGIDFCKPRHVPLPP